MFLQLPIRLKHRIETTPIDPNHLDVESASRGLRIDRSTGNHRPFSVNLRPKSCRTRDGMARHRRPGDAHIILADVRLIQYIPDPKEIWKTDRASTSAGCWLVLRRDLFHLIDHANLQGHLRLFQSEAILFLERREQGRKR